MIKYILSISLIVCTFIGKVNGQDNKELAKFYTIQDSARYFEKIGKYAEAIALNERMLRYTQFEVSRTSYGALSNLYLLQGNIESSTKYLEKYILSCGPIEADWIDYHYKKKIKINLDSLNNKFPMNYTVYHKIYKLFCDDQRTRKIATFSDINTGLRDIILDKSDSMSYLELKSIINSLGHLPAMSEIGMKLQGMFTMAIMNHHFHRDTAYWAPLYRTAINNGTMSNFTLPFLIDDYHVRDLRETKPVYCVYPNFANRYQYAEPLYPEKIDQLRAEVYLPSLYFASQIDSMTLPKSYQYSK